MTTQHDHTLSAALPTEIDGYEFAAETERARRLLPDVVVAGHALNRATARATPGDEPADAERTRNEHREEVFTTTLDPDSPVIELGWPSSGHFVRDSRGVHLDLVLGVAQRVIDERHPAIAKAVSVLDSYGLFAHREINTDDYLRPAPHAEGLHMPQDVARLLNDAIASSYPGSGSWRTFFTNSGAESTEACLKLACMVRYKRFLAAHGEATLARVMEELGIAEFAPLEGEPSRPETVYEDYPFFLVGLESAFHGRTMGCLSVTASKKAQKAGFPRLRWVRHIPLNSPEGTLAGLIDERSVSELLATPGELRRVIESGRIPGCLFAGLLMEPFQGEGGYVPATREFTADVAATCRRHGALFMLDEVQTFGRTGTLWFGEQLGTAPDAVAMAKGLFTGAMVARAELGDLLHPGWHSNTWGGGKIFDNQVAYALLDTLVNSRSELFDGRSLPENQMLKGRLLERGLALLAERHPELVTSYIVRGGMARLSVRRRHDVVMTAWRHGLKLLGCGRKGEVSAIRLLFLADVLAREIHEAIDLLDATLSEVKATSAT